MGNSKLCRTDTEKQLANPIARDAWDPGFFATRALRRMRRRPRIITACWKQFEFQLGL